MLESVSLRALTAALDGLSERQRAVSDDISNVNTPYFTARSVDFESNLRSALADGTDPMATTPTITASTRERDLNYNNVDLEAETTLGIETNLRYELALRATGDRFSLLRSAIRGS
ncbi:MAG: flagellar biosynthesis protein FlgB [Kineosporiaceae bacterium]